MALGMSTPTVAPRPRLRPWATVVQEYLPLEVTGRWQNGVKFIPFGTTRTVVGIADPCLDRLRQANPTDRGTEVTFYPFLIETSVDCTLMSMNEVDLQEELESFARAHLALEAPVAIARQVMDGQPAGMNPSFISEADPMTGVDRTLIGALQAVERGLAERIGDGQGYIHIPSWFLSTLQAGGGLRFVDGSWHTGTGHIIIADAGYLGWSPTADGAVAGETWIYGSGPVEYITDDSITFDGTKNLTSYDTHNDWDVYGAQLALAIFEPDHVVAAAVTTSTDAADLEQA